MGPLVCLFFLSFFLSLSLSLSLDLFLFLFLSLYLSIFLSFSLSLSLSEPHHASPFHKYAYVCSKYKYILACMHLSTDPDSHITHIGKAYQLPRSSCALPLHFRARALSGLIFSAASASRIAALGLFRTTSARARMANNLGEGEAHVVSQ